MIKCVVIHPESDDEWIKEFNTHQEYHSYCGDHPYLQIHILCEFYDKIICSIIWRSMNVTCNDGQFSNNSRCYRVIRRRSVSTMKLNELKKNGRVEL